MGQPTEEKLIRSYLATPDLQTALVHELIEARDERRLLNLQRKLAGRSERILSVR